MCNSSSCPYNKTGVGADFLCKCEQTSGYRFSRDQYRLDLADEILYEEEDNYIDTNWNEISEYFTQE